MAEKGITYQVKCPFCGREFEWSDGVGQRVDVLHCDKCGRELWTTERLLEFENIKCPCGGYFDKEVPIICPSCRIELSNPRDNVINAIRWD